MQALESDDFQKRLLETFHEAAQKAGPDPDDYLEYGLQALYALQSVHWNRRPMEGTAFPPDMRKNEQVRSHFGRSVYSTEF